MSLSVHTLLAAVHWQIRDRRAIAPTANVLVCAAQDGPDFCLRGSHSAKVSSKPSAWAPFLPSLLALELAFNQTMLSQAPFQPSPPNTRVLWKPEEYISDKTLARESRLATSPASFLLHAQLRCSAAPTPS